MGKICSRFVKNMSCGFVRKGYNLQDNGRWIERLEQPDKDYRVTGWKKHDCKSKKNIYFDIARFKEAEGVVY
jgi:hypothetical protein